MPRKTSPTRRKLPEEYFIALLDNKRQAVIEFPTNLTLQEVGYITTQLLKHVVKGTNDGVQQHGTDHRDSE